MKITKRQLRRIIKEAGKWDDYDEYGNPKDGPKLYGPDAAAAGIGVAAQQMVDKGKKGKPAVHPDYEGLPQSDIDYYELADDYAMWVKENGHITPAASSVMATYFLEKGLEDDHEKHEMLGKAFGVEHDNIMADIRRQKAERAATMGESRSKITKKQLVKIVREEARRLAEAGYYHKLPKNHVDGTSWSGSLEDLAHEQTRSWGGGQVVDMPGFKSDLKRAKQLSTGKDGSPLRSAPSRIQEAQLRRIVREACALEDRSHKEVHADHMTQPGPRPEVPSPQDYDAVRSFMNTNPDIVDLGLGMVMDLVGVSCERSTAQAIIDHLQGMLHGADSEVDDHSKIMISPEVLDIGGI